jgi:hypothetical protein
VLLYPLNEECDTCILLRVQPTLNPQCPLRCLEEELTATNLEPPEMNATACHYRYGWGKKIKNIYKTNLRNWGWWDWGSWLHLVVGG